MVGYRSSRAAVVGGPMSLSMGTGGAEHTLALGVLGALLWQGVDHP